MRQYILLTLAVLAGVLAFFIAKTQLEKKYAVLNRMGEKVRLVVPIRDMAAGEKIDPHDLTLRELYKDDTSDNQIGLNDVALIVRQTLAFSVKKGTPLRWQDFQVKELAMGGMLARMVPDGERALAVAVDATSSVAGMIRPNDHVDILGTFRFPDDSGANGKIEATTLTLLQNVTVLGVGQQTSAMGTDDRRMGSYGSLTLSLTPKETELLVFAQQQGKLTFTLRNPREVTMQPETQSLDFATVRKNLAAYNQERADRINGKDGGQ